jgi:hypothetical protein
VSRTYLSYAWSYPVEFYTCVRHCLTGVNNHHHNHITRRGNLVDQAHERRSLQQRTIARTRRGSTNSSRCVTRINQYYIGAICPLGCPKKFRGRAAFKTLPLIGAPDSTRTSDHPVSSRALYPTELREQGPERIIDPLRGNSPEGYKVARLGFRPRYGLTLVRRQSLTRLSTGQRSPYSDEERGKTESFLFAPSFFKMALECSKHSGAVGFLGPTISGKERQTDAVKDTDRSIRKFSWSRSAWEAVTPRSLTKDRQSHNQFFRDCSRMQRVGHAA